MDERLSRYRVTVLGRDAWRAGAPNSKIEDSIARVNVDGFSLQAGAPYEVEAAIGTFAEAARGLAAAQEINRALSQLVPPVNPNLFYRWKGSAFHCLGTAGLTALSLDDDLAASDFGIFFPAGLDDLAEASRRRRAAVEFLRRLGWSGPIVLPGLNPRAQILLIPSDRLRNGAVLVTRSTELLLPVSKTMVDYLLGLREDLPPASDIVENRLSRPETRERTVSWQPTNQVTSTRS
jgi:hypothetical protein